MVLPVHPKTKRLIADNRIPVSFSVTDVVGYNEMQNLLHNSGFVITDSGGFSREAFFAQKPTVIIMDKPFWPEIFKHGNCLQANATAEDIIKKFNEVRASSKSFNTSVFGDGNAAGKICEAILKF
ncbi:UDP-2,3-diacetamido-2,3-dideoxy-D-glucuronate 2-epimerase [compost metagenome]